MVIISLICNNYTWYRFLSNKNLLYDGLMFLSSGLSLQEEPGVERGQSGYSSPCSRSGLGRTAGH